ncbi:MAG TPA: hypothetical protein VLM37_00535 [Fibrobacteraceae bacterium]|nr:hypothetical protein [Fibrobacteraceae bacterium]
MPAHSATRTSHSAKDKKQLVLRWQQEHQIPGKVQALLTASPDSSGDWCIRNVKHGKQFRLEILGPSDNLLVPDVVTTLFEYLIQEHQYYMRKAMTQLWIRAAAPGAWALLLHSQIRGAGTGHALKLLESHLRRNMPEVVALHRVETRPWYPFRLDLPPVAMKYDLVPVFGPEFFPLGTTDHEFHILEWLPQLREPYLHLPERLLAGIHPMPGDRLLDLYCGSAFLGCQLASRFEEVYCVDPRGISKQSVLHNLQRRHLTNVHYMQKRVDAEFIANFVRRPGPWTVILNPQAGEALPMGVIRNLSTESVGRVIHIGSDWATLVGDIRKWRRAGMLLRKIVPLDLNPTSSRNLELALFFAPDREGVLRQGLPSPQPDDIEEEALSSVPRFVQKRTRPRTRKG